MALTIDELQVQIQAKSTTAASSIDALTHSLTALKTATKGGAGLTSTIHQLQNFQNAIANIKAPTDKIKAIVESFAPLQTIQKSNLGSALNQLSKIPIIIAELDKADLAKFNTQIQQLTTYMQPLAAEMEKVSNGFSKLPVNIQKAINANAKLTSSNNRTGKSYGVLGTGIQGITARLSLYYYGLKRVSSVVGDLFNVNSDYIEAVNLATITMRDATGAALEYAESLERIMGINQVEWLSSLGSFNQMMLGFGVNSNIASEMSTQLTQLGYDIQSAFNVQDLDFVMQRLQSGIAGQIKGMREYGVELSVAAMQEYILAKGITASWKSLTQAEKAMLRYMKIMETTQNIQGDLARTIATPANSLRILSNQWEVAKRKMGQVISVIAVRVIPIFQALVEIIGDTAARLAAFWGYALPEIDYSGLDNVTWGAEDAEEAVSSATNAVNELKNAVLGIDELNVLNPNSGSDALEVASLLNTLDLSGYSYDFMANIDTSKIEEIKDKLYSIWEYTKWIALALLTWKVTESFLTEISTLKSLVDKLGGGSLKNALGITLAITGLTMEFSGAMALGAGSTELKDYIKTALGAALGIAGSLLIFGTGPVGWAVGIAASLTVLIAGIAIGNKQAAEKEFKESELGQFLAQVQANIDASEATNLKIKTTIQLNIETVQGIDDEEQAALKMIDKLYALIELPTKTEGDITLISTYVNKLNELDLGNVTLEYDELTGKINLAKDALTELVNKAYEQIRLEAYKDMLGEMYTTQAEALRELNTSQNDYIALQQRRGDLESQYSESLAYQNQLVQQYGYDFRGWSKEQSLLINAALENSKKLKNELDKVNGSIDKSHQAVLDTRDAYLKASDSVNYYESQISDLSKSTVTATTDTTQLGNTVSDTVGTINQTLGKIEPVKVNVDTSALRGLNNTISETIKNLPPIVVPVTASVSVTSKTTPDLSTPNVAYDAYASGGFPTPGDLFIANEAGPEMVGTVGGRTAVANGDDIVQAVAQGVYEAMVSAQSKSGGNNGGGFAIYIDGKQVEAVVRETQQKRGAAIATGGLLNYA